MNVLLTSAARYSFLIEPFRAALGAGGKVFVADTATLPVAGGADATLITPPADYPGYIGTLLAFCKQKGVELLVPLGSAELAPLAKAEVTGSFRALGVTVIISSKAIIELSLDRWGSYRVLRYQGFNVPPTYRSLEAVYTALECGNLVFPLFLKPRWRSAPGVDKVYDETELELSYRRARRRLTNTSTPGSGSHSHTNFTLIQQSMSGDEYEFDVVNNLRGEYATTLVRKKLGFRAGETDSAVTADVAAFNAVGETLGKRLGHVGSLSVEAFYDGNAPQIFGVRAHLGDDYAFSHVAGANVPAMLVAWARGERPGKAWLHTEPGVTAVRYSEIVRVATRNASSGA